jgi:hypothetical protein
MLNWGRPSTLFAWSAIFEARRQPHQPSDHLGEQGLVSRTHNQLQEGRLHENGLASN